MDFQTAVQSMLFPLGAIIIAAAITKMCIKFLPTLGFIDMPDSRRVHVKPIPRGGGVAIIFSFFFLTSIFTLFSYTDGTGLFLRDLLPPAIIIFIIGVLDDRFSLGAKTKLLAQIAAGFLVWWSPLRESPQRLNELIIALPPWASCLITIFLVVAIINAFNLIDGLDGVAAGLSVVSAICLAFWAVMICRRIDLMIIYLILAGGCLGFLHYNFSPAKIFMGDTGSNFLGLFFAVGCINSMTSAATTVAVLVPLMAVGVPIFDVFLALWRRLLRRISSTGTKGIMSADLDHLHHRIYAQNHDQRKTALLLYAFAGFFALAGVIVIISSHGSGSFGYLVVVLVIVFAVRRFATVEMMDSAKILIKGLKRPRRNLLFILSHPFFDLVCLGGAHVAANVILRMPPLQMSFFSLPYILVFYVTLLLSGIYRIYWFRSSIKDYRFLAEMILLASLLSLLANRLFDGPWTMARAMLFFMFAGVGIIGERLILRYIEGFMLRQIFVRRQAAKEQVDCVVIFGGGQGCRTFLSSTAYTYQDLFSIRGIIDDDTSLRGMSIYGYKVLGGRAELDAIYNKKPFQRMVITSYRISDDTIQELREFAAAKNIKILRFKTSTADISLT